jgi:hypothetical protein
MTIQALYPDISPSLSLDFANVKQLDPRVTFARASIARYYDGKTVAKAEENLVLQSQTFNNAVWSKSRATITANTVTAPDGTLTASTLTEDTSASTEHRLIQTISSAITAGVAYTYSIFLKADTRSQILIRTGNSTTDSNGVFFDLSAETASNVGTGATSSSITAVGNGWYRCVLTYSSVGPFFYVGLATGGTTIYTGDGTSGLFVWGAQLEQRSSVTAYTATTTQPITNYIPVLLSAADNEARFDHNPTTSESLGLLIEEQRTNLILQSEDFSTTWTNTRTSQQTNVIVAPDGTLTGDKLVIDTTANSNHSINQNVSVTSGTTYTLSVFAKAGEFPRINLRFSAQFPTGNATFNLTDGTIASGGTIVATSITPVGNGWYRCSFTQTANATGTAGTQIFLSDIGGVEIATANGFDGIYIWGAQLEAGAFPTSYIPTVASQVTRSADAASMTGTNFSSWYRQDEGSFFATASIGQGVFPYLLYAGDGTDNNRHIILRNSSIASLSSTFSMITTQNNTTQSNLTAFSGNSTRFAYGYKLDDYAGVTDLTATKTGISGIVPTIDRLFIGSRFGTTFFANGTIKKLAFYPKRLTNVQLQAITT